MGARGMSDDRETYSEHVTQEDGVLKIDASELNGVIALPAVPKDDLRELIEEWREKRQGTLDSDFRTHEGHAHRNGVACGMDYCIEEAEDLL